MLNIIYEDEKCVVVSLKELNEDEYPIIYVSASLWNRNIRKPNKGNCCNTISLQPTSFLVKNFGFDLDNSLFNFAYIPKESKRGYGYTIKDNSEHLIKVIQTLHYDKVYLIGSSYGGLIAALASKYDYVDRVLTSGTPYCGVPLVDPKRHTGNTLVKLMCSLNYFRFVNTKARIDDFLRGINKNEIDSSKIWAINGLITKEIESNGKRESVMNLGYKVYKEKLNMDSDGFVVTDVEYLKSLDFYKLEIMYDCSHLYLCGNKNFEKEIIYKLKNWKKI